MKKSDRYTELEELWVQVIMSIYAKPDNRWFWESIDALELTTQEVLMVWDNFLTDGGAIYAGIDFIKVAPIETGDENRSMKRQAQVIFRKLVDFKAQLMGKL